MGKALAFFHAAGLPAVRDADGLRIKETTVPTPSVRSAASWEEWVDEIAAEHYGEQLLASIARGVGPAGRGLRAVPGTRGLRLVDDERLPVAVVRATQAKVKGRPVIRGNFLTGGKHWGVLRSDIELSLKERMKGRPSVPGAGKAARKRAAQLERLRAAVEANPGASIEQLSEAAGIGERNVVKLLAILEGDRGLATQGRDAPTEAPEGEFQENDLDYGHADKDGDTDEEPEQFALEGLEDVAGLLSAAGIEADTDGDRLKLAGDDLRPPASTVEDRDALRRWTDAVVAERFSELLVDRARTELPVPAAVRMSANGGLAVKGRGGITVATVTATIGSGDQFEPIEGNYLVPGPHWKRLADRIALELPAEGEYVNAALHRDFPDRGGADLADAALEASRRLHEDRARVFDNELRIDVAEHSLVFAPLRQAASGTWFSVTRPVVELPFTFGREGEFFSGALHLRSLPGLMPCEWHQPSDAETLALGWSLALTAYVELACYPQERVPDQSQRGSARGRGRRRPGRQPRESSRPRTRRLGTRNVQALPTGFRPQGQTMRYIASWVSGHIRQLQEGQTHSEEAAANAAGVGITLRTDETWVRPYSRGLPDDAVLHFSWTGPEWLRGRPA